MLTYTNKCAILLLLVQSPIFWIFSQISEDDWRISYYVLLFVFYLVLVGAGCGSGGGVRAVLPAAAARRSPRSDV